MSAPIADAAERARALQPEGSFIVQAPAGSGKTELLTQRALVLLARVDAPEEVVAVTFTRKAVAEMRHRIVDALRAAAGPEPEAEHQRRTWTLARRVLERDAELGWGLLLAPSRLRVLTYDALAGALARQSPVMSGLSPGHRTTDQPERLYRDAARATLALADGNDNNDELAETVRATLAHFDGRAERVIEQIVAMLARRDQWLPLVAGDAARPPRERIERCLQAVRARAFDAARQALGDERLTKLLDLARYARAQRQLADPEREAPEIAAEQVEDMADDPAAWQAVTDLLLTGKDTWRQPKGLNINDGFPPAKAGPEAAARKRDMQQILTELAGDEDALAAVRALRRLPAAKFEDGQWRVLQQLLDTLRLAAAELTLVFAHSGEVDFIEIAARAGQALGDPEAPSELAMKLDYRIRHLLLDEFQDTSQTQFRLVEQLTAGWQAGDGRTLFAVGDPMQSIYRFRQADVGLFLKAAERGIGQVPMEALRLSMNFRSRPGIVEWVNRAFDGRHGGAFPLHSDPVSGASEYSRSQAARDAAGEPNVCWHVGPADAQREAEALVEVIRAELAADDKASIAVLVRARSHLSRILPALREAGIAFQAVDLDRLIDRSEVSDLRALAAALSHPLDRLAWFSVLRAPWAGLRLPDLQAVADAVPPERAVIDWLREGDFAGLSDEGARVAARLREVLVPAADARGTQPFAQLLRGVWLALGGADLHAQARGVIEPFFELLEAHSVAGDLADLPAFDAALAKRSVLDEAVPGCRVQVLTMHKAKGLQFDVVLLPGLAQGNQPRDRLPVIWSSIAVDEPEPVMAAVHAAGDERDPTYDWLRGVEDEREALERARLLYVAVTRARERLHLFASLAKGADGTWKAPQKGSLLSLLGAVFDPPASTPTEAEAAVTEREDPQPPLLRRLPPQRSLPAWPEGVVAPAAEAADDAPPEFNWAGEAARVIGVVFHRFAETCARRGDAPLPAPAAVRGALAAELARHGLPPGERDRALDRLMVGIEHLLCSERGRWLLDAHEAAGAELQLGFGGGLRIVDRCFVADGTRYIIDYKTSWHEGGGREAFIDAEVARYRDQLEGYARLFADIESRPRRCALYFPMMGQWREWPA